MSNKKPKIKIYRSHNYSSSPLPDLKSSENRNSYKISLLNLNDSYQKLDSSKLSQSLNSVLPQIPQAKKASHLLDKHHSSTLSKRKLPKGNQSPSFSYYFSPKKDMSVPFKDVKVFFDEDNKKNIDIQRLEEILKKQDFIKQKRDHIYKFEPNIKPKLYQSILHISLLLKIFNEEFLTKCFDNNEESKVTGMEKIYEIERSFYKVYEDFVLEINDFQRSLSDSKQNQLVLEQKLEKLLNERSEIDKKSKKIVVKTTPSDKEMGFLLFENTKLEMEVQKLQEKLKIFENYDVGPIMKELEMVKFQSTENIKQLQYELNIFKGKDDGHQNLINYYKNSITKLEKEVKHWIATSGENQKIVDKLTEKYENLKNVANKYRELYLMEYEEISMLNAKKYEGSLVLHDMQDKIKLLSFKIDKLTVQKGDNVNENDYKNDLNMLSTFSDFFSENLYKKLTKDNPISLQLLSNISIKAPNITNTRSYESNSTHPSFLKRLNFLKAPFFKLIEHRFKTSSYAFKANKKPHFNELLSKIRGIFDSKYNEFLYFSDAKLYTSFPDFVYSWLGRYEIDFLLKKIKKADITAYNVNLDDIRIQFLLDLTNPKIEKLWECSTFCEFFEEKISLDELYFYLHCRNLLFKGPQLKYTSAFFELIHYVPFQRAEELIDLIMHKYDVTIKSTVKGKMSEKSKRKGAKSYIDSAFVLRVLLEYYRLERIDKYYLLEELFNSKLHKEDDKETVSYENFKKILQFNWPQVTDLECCELFRECWGVGQGTVNAEVFFVVANENKFFIKTLKVPSIMSFEENPKEINPYESIRNKFYELFNMVKDKIQGVEEIISGFGLEMLDEKFRKMVKIIQAEFQMPSEEFKEKFISNFSLDFEYLLNGILKIAYSGHILRNSLNEIKFLRNNNEFKTIREEILEIRKEDTLREIKENVYARKIQKKLKAKIAIAQKPGRKIEQVVKMTKKNV